MISLFKIFSFLIKLRDKNILGIKAVFFGFVKSYDLYKKNPFSIFKMNKKAIYLDYS